MRFLSDFPSGNGKLLEQKEYMQEGKKIEEITFLAESRAGEPMPLWFYFRLEDLKGDILRIRFANSAVCLGDTRGWATNRPVFRTAKTDWQRIASAESARDAHHILQTWYELPIEGDWLEFAFCFPYPLANLLERVEKCGIFSTSIIGYSNHTRPIYRFATEEGEPEGKKPSIIFISRQHAGEVTASWQIDGIMSYLASPEGAKMREKFIFWFIPMIDIDGVEEGYYGKDQTQGDLNRSWGAWFTGRVELTAVEDCLWQLRDCSDIKLMLDMHSPGHNETDCYFAIPGKTNQEHREELRAAWNILNRELSACGIQEVKFNENPVGKNTSSQVGMTSTQFADMYGFCGGTFECSYQGEHGGSRYYTIEDYRKLGECILKALVEAYK